MLRKLTLVFTFLLIASFASAEVVVKNGKFWFNGEKKDIVWGRTSFKLANIITYHYTGQGGGKYNLGYAMEWVKHNQRLFGKDVVLRVFLETAGWSPCDDENGTPENCMFGSEPRDQGFWVRARLRDGNRETEVHPVGKAVLEWFFKTSQETGCAFELVIDATLKHDDIPKGEIDHVIRVVGVYMGEVLQPKYPQALIIPNMRNEWNAHNQSGHTLNDVNMWAVRWDRDNYSPGWNAPKIVDGGGGNTFAFDVGPEAGKYRAGMIHPTRDGGWEQFPNRAQMNQLRTDARGMPVGSNESMYYVEQEDRPRAEGWYRSGGWTSNWSMYKQHLESLEAGGFDYIIVHDEKGVQCDLNWPRPMTRVEQWALTKFGGEVCEAPAECGATGGTWDTTTCVCNCPDGKNYVEGQGCVGDEPPPPPTEVSYDRIINEMYMRILERPADPDGLAVYNEWLARCYDLPIDFIPCSAMIEDILIRSDEYKEKNKR